MSFYATRFTFDGESSENYSLTISSDNSESVTPFPGDVKLYSEKLFRRSYEYLYGVSVEPMLEFPVSFMTENVELTAQDLETIGKWLFGRSNYAKLRIMQYDMQDVYYDCFFINPKIIRIGNIIRGVSATVHCKDAWGLSALRTYNYTSGTVNHYNYSDNTGYTYPKLIITANSFGGEVSITNVSDNNRTFAFTGISANEVLTIDNSLQVITSSTGLRRLSNFNKKFFRLKNGLNVLHIDSGTSPAIQTAQIIYQTAKKIGG